MYIPENFEDGKRTGFAQSVKNGTMKHHFVVDYDNYWKDVLEEVRDNKAYIAICTNDLNGTDKSVDIKEIKRIYRYQNIGFQKLVYEVPTNKQTGIFYIRKSEVQINEFALRNGMSKKDLLSFFKGVAHSELLLIHFTPFRY